MIKNLFGYPLIFAITLYLGILNKREWLLFVCFAEAIMFLIQVMALFYQKRNLKIEITLPETVLMEEEKARAEFSLENFGVLPVRRICFFVQYQYLSGKKKQKKELTVWGNADREDTQSYELLAGPFPGGQFLFEVSHAEIYDYFGIFSLKIKIRKKRKIIILPEFTDMEIPPLQREVPAENEIDVEKRGQEAGELYDIREYQAGDSLKQIYWKRSAAREELLYRENGALMGVRAVLFFKLPQDMDGSEFHDQIKLAGSFLYSMSERGYLHFFVWENRESPVLTRKLIRTQEDIFAALTEFINGISEENSAGGKKRRFWSGYGKKENIYGKREKGKKYMEQDERKRKESTGKKNAEKRMLKKEEDMNGQMGKRKKYRQEEIRRIEEMKYRYERQFVGEECPEAFFVLVRKEAFGKKETLLFHETEIMQGYSDGKPLKMIGK
jgi:hypothetical protein